MTSYTLVVGSNSFLGKSFIECYRKKINILGISFSQKKIEDYKKKISFRFSDKKLVEITKDKKIVSLIYFHSYGTSNNQNSIRKIYFSNFILAKKFFKFAILLNAKFIFFGSVSEFDKDINNHYASAKREMTRFLFNNTKKSKIPIIILKLFYIYGLNENKNRLLSKIKKSFNEKKIFYLKNPDQKIDFLHVSDFLKALFKVINTKHEKKKNIYKLCYGEKIELKKVFKDYKNVKIKKNQYFIKKINYNIIGHKKFNKYYNWNPKISPSNGINDFLKRI